MKARFFAVIVSPFLLYSSVEGASQTGIDVTVEASAGVRGGAQRGEALNSLALIHSHWSQSASQDEGFSWSAYLSGLALAGRGPTERFLGDFLTASNIEGHESARVYSWWLEAQLNQWSLRAGALLADEEFAGTEGGGNFFNSAFGWPPFLSANTVNTGPAFYVAAPGVRLERAWGANSAWRVGVYDGDSFDSPTGDPWVTRGGLHYKVGGDQGWFVISELALVPAGSAYRIKVGAWLHTATFTHVRDDASGRPFALSGDSPREFSSNRGAYALFERTLAGLPGQAGNIEYFVRGGVSPSDRNSIAWALDTGLGWTGPLPSRPGDVLALGLAHAAFSSPYAAGIALADPSSPQPEFEQVIETSYTLQLNEHLSLQPDFQYIRKSGGSSARKNAFVFLLRLNASY